ncbi:dynein light chain 1, cytoplasmic [Umbelopsis sp. PMI_123]|nr:dynein light chain 1, cytoplasmic [Umbelopsis sp. PMI_123]
MAETKAIIKSADMSEEMQQEAVDCGTQALEKYNIEKDIAAHIKREFDKKYGPTWHCVVGRNFGSFVTHGTYEAILQVILVVLFGYGLARSGFFPKENLKWLSNLNLKFFTPCLLFSKMASVISLEIFLAFWPIPLFFLAFAGLSFITAQLCSRLLGISAAYRRFVTACVMFSNTNSLPIAVMTSLAVSEAGKLLYWKADDSRADVAARGISYILFYAIFGNIIRWSYGYKLMTIPHEEEQQATEAILPTAKPNQLPLITQTNEFHYDSLGTCPPSSLSNTDIRNEHHHVQSRRRSESSTSELSGKQFLSAYARISPYMSPPLWAALAALFVGLTPLKPILFDKHRFLYPSFTKAIESCGSVAVPIILVCLGAQLSSFSLQHHCSSDDMKKPIVAAVSIRMFFMPLLVVPITTLFIAYGEGISSLASDPVFAVVMIMIGCAPTAINLAQMTQVYPNFFEEEMLRVLFWSYGVICTPMMTIVVLLALEVVQKVT